MEETKNKTFSTNFLGYKKAEVDKEIFNLEERIKILEADINFLKQEQNKIAAEQVYKPKNNMSPKLSDNSAKVFSCPNSKLLKLQTSTEHTKLTNVFSAEKTVHNIDQKNNKKNTGINLSL